LLTEAITNTDLAVRPSKIIAGLEPTETNLLLQAIGKALDKKIDSSLYINQLQSGQIINNEKSKKPKKTLDKNEKVKKSTKPVGGSEEKTRSTPRNNDKKVSNETPKSTNREKPKRVTKESKSKTGSNEGKPRNKEKTTKKGKTKEESPKEVTHPAQKSNENLEVSVPSVDAVNEVKETNKENTNAAVEISAVEVNSNRSLPDETVRTEDVAKTVIDSSVNEASADNEPKKRSTSASRPKSARPRSGDRKEKPVSEENKEPIHIQSRPKSSLRPPSVRPSSARPGAPRLRPDSAFPVKEVVPMGKINVIVESFDKDVDEEETVIIQSNPEVVDEQNENVADVPGDNKGHLVEQILEQINESDNKSSATKSEEWQKDGKNIFFFVAFVKWNYFQVFYGKESTSKETNNLRSLIQTLTKTANPLGKLLNYLHEDIDAMHAELELWTNTKRQLFDEIAKQKK
jgi:TRAF3-interacting protein 1